MFPFPCYYWVSEKAHKISQSGKQRTLWARGSNRKDGTWEGKVKGKQLFRAQINVPERSKSLGRTLMVRCTLYDNFTHRSKLFSFSWKSVSTTKATAQMTNLVLALVLMDSLTKNTTTPQTTKRKEGPQPSSCGYSALLPNPGKAVSCLLCLLLLDLDESDSCWSNQTWNTVDDISSSWHGDVISWYHKNTRH